MSDHSNHAPARLRQVREIYVALSFIDALATQTQTLVSIGDLVAHLCGSYLLSAEQMSYVLSNRRLQNELQSLARDFGNHRKLLHATKGGRAYAL